MITKERLQELIEQKKSIYWKFAKIKPSSWSKYTIMGNTIVKGNLKEIYSLDDLFETKEDFEWHRQFGCIERTERLELPTWEEFDKKCYFEFVTADGTKLVLEKTLTVDCDREPISYYVLEILVNDYDHRLLFEAEYTKENYTLACRKAKELFLGEKK